MANLFNDIFTGSGESNVHWVNAEGETGSCSVTELQMQVRAVAHSMRKLGLGEGTRVMVCAQASLPALVMILACMHEGVAVIPQGLPHDFRQLDTLCRMHSPDLVYVDNQGFPDHSCDNCQVLSGSTALRQFAGKSQPAGQLEPCDLPGQGTALMLQTSGSTGKPKIIEYSLENLQTFMVWHHQIYAQYFEGRESELPLVSVFPFSHLAGVALAMEGLGMGRELWLLETFEPMQVLKILQETRAHFIALVSSMYPHLLRRSQQMPEPDLSALEYCICLGEAADEALLQAVSDAFGAQALCAYGLSECLPGLAHSRKDLQSGVIPAGACGRNIFGELMLIDVEGEPQEHFGRLCVKNPTVFSCYSESALEAEAIQEGWFITQDLFYRDEQGYYFHRGRADDLFTWHGKTTSPAELESLASLHRAVEKACCIPIRNSRHAVAPGLVVQARDLDRTTLMDFLLKQGKSHLVPARLVITATIPVTGPGKLDRHACLDLLMREEGRCHA